LIIAALFWKMTNNRKYEFEKLHISEAMHGWHFVRRRVAGGHPFDWRGRDHATAANLYGTVGDAAGFDEQ
jgi:hypothetical protein